MAETKVKSRKDTLNIKQTKKTKENENINEIIW